MDVRPAELGDHARVAALMQRLGMSAPDEMRWREIWTANPAGRADAPIGWVVGDGAEVAGFIGNLPRLMWDGARTRIARVPTSWAVDPSARAHSLPLLFKWLNQPDADLLLNSSANVDAAVLFDKLKVSRVPCPSLGFKWVWVLSWSGLIPGLLRRTGLGALSFLGSLASPIDRLAGIGASAKGSGMEWREEFGPEFDRLWSVLATRPVLQSVRDAANLRWCYGRALAERRAWLVVRAERGALRGYAVFGRQDVRSMGLKRMKLVDLVTLDGDPAPYVRAAIARGRREGVHLLESAGFDRRLEPATSRTGPIRLEAPSWPAFWRTRDPELARRLGTESAWSFSPYDGDSSLW